MTYPPRNCVICGKKTEALSAICADHEDGGVTGALYQRIRAACGDISSLTQDELDQHALGIAQVVAHATALGEPNSQESILRARMPVAQAAGSAASSDPLESGSPSAAVSEPHVPVHVGSDGASSEPSGIAALDYPHSPLASRKAP